MVSFSNPNGECLGSLPAWHLGTFPPPLGQEYWYCWKGPSIQEKSSPTLLPRPCLFMVVTCPVENMKKEGLQAQRWVFLESSSSPMCADHGAGFPVSWVCTALQRNRHCIEVRLTWGTGVHLSIFIGFFWRRSLHIKSLEGRPVCRMCSLPSLRLFTGRAQAPLQESRLKDFTCLGVTWVEGSPLSDSLGVSQVW